MPGNQRAAVQAPRRDEVKSVRTASNFQQNCTESVEPCRLLGDPQHIGQLFGLGDQKTVRRKAETCRKPRRIRPAGLAKDFRRTDPQQRRGSLDFRQ